MNREKPKRKTRTLHKVYAAVVLLLGVLIVALGILVLFHTRAISIEGNEYSSVEEVQEWVKKDKGALNTLYLLGKYSLGTPKLMPFMESVQVSLKNPWTVRMKVKEKKIAGSIQSGAEYACFDQKGLVVYVSAAPVEGVPVIEGLEVKEAALYKVLDVTDEKVFKRILDTTQMLKKCELTPDRILSDGKNVTLYFGAICVSLGSSDLKNKVSQLPAILEKLAGQEGTLKMEHYTEGSKYISFQKTVPPPEGDQTNGDQNDDSNQNSVDRGSSDDIDNPGGDSGDSYDPDSDDGSGSYDDPDDDDSGSDDEDGYDDSDDSQNDDY